MDDVGGCSSLSPFLPAYRASGVLLHVTSLPSPYGIGDLGPMARAWIDRLRDAAQTWWQVLPLGPTWEGNSPYGSLSSFAGNWLLISPDDLIADGLLRVGDVTGHSFPANAVDFESVIAFKQHLLETAWTNFVAGSGKSLKPAFNRFCEDHAHWLEDYALFQALKTSRGGATYLEWPAELVQRKPTALARARSDLAHQIDQIRLSQFLFFRQAEALKSYAHSRDIRLIGDIPFYVSPESSDVWANPEHFLLDGDCRPRVVGGVPPDYFAVEGQLWGNPVYDWEELRKSDYRWCIDRIRAVLELVDVVRLDHFRGFAAAWHVPAGAPTAQTGHWSPGPGADFFNAIQRDLGALPFLAEDLGIITEEVNELRDQFDLPGSRVLQFGFDGHADNPHLPENYIPNTVVYTGTHDNNTTRGWFEELPDELRETIWRYLKRPAGEGDEIAAEMMRQAWSSVAALALAPLQDLLNLGEEARMNVPGRATGNWHWRCTAEMLSTSAFERLAELTETTNRTAACEPRLCSDTRARHRTAEP